MNEAAREDAKAALQSVGVPAHIIDGLLKKDLALWIEHVQYAVFLGLMVAGFAVGGWLIWPALEQLTEANARQHAETAGALLYSYNFGLSLVLAIFAWIFVVGLAATLLTNGSARMRASAFVVAALQSRGSGLVRWSMRRQLQPLEQETDPDAYVREAAARGLMSLALATLALATLSVAAVKRDVQAHRVYTAEGYIHSPFFPWASRDLRRWEDATRVELGCNYIASEDASDVIYNVHFPDGAEAFPASARALSGHWVDQLQEIDAALRRSDAQFERWRWLNRDPIHPRCLEQMLEALGPKYPSLQVMLQTGGYPGALD